MIIDQTTHKQYIQELKAYENRDKRNNKLCEYAKESELFDKIMTTCKKRNCDYQLYTMGVNYCTK